MENKKRAYTNTGSTPNSDSQINETVLNHIHQHNTAPQHLHLLQYGLKIPNHQHAQLNQTSSHQHQLTSQLPFQHHSNPANVYQNQIFLHQQYPHQHQQKYQNHHNESFQNHSHYHYQPAASQSNVHAHNVNQLNQQNAHIWVPHRPPEHYHPQQLLQPQAQKAEQMSKLSHMVSSQLPKSKEPDRKKYNNNHQKLRSPAAKRPFEAPVKLQGWLHKQGSDGLMLWKRRWFVLSEYCLFYYKGPEEEKVLGSILLPSYKVSVCEPNDKINRKFAFKCEHANMRTYILAADSYEIMMQWANVLNLACLLQNSNKNEPNINQMSSTSKIETPVIDLRQPNQPQNIRNTPIHIHTSSNTTDLSNPSQQELSQYLQPLYANAPPKPRRLTDGYVSPSSDIMERNSSDSKLIAYQPTYHYNVKPTYLQREIVKSPINVYGNVQQHRQYDQAFQQICNKHLHIQEYSATKEKQSLERRTPDTYGRSKLNPPKGNQFSDYEDVYMDHYMYKRPLSPLSYSDNKLNPTLSVPVVRPYTPLTMYGPKENLSFLSEQQFKKNSNIVQRPHSADFLDYEVKHQNSKVIAKQSRPKSSLDINRNVSSDNYFYSKQHYAEKMRKSVQYLPNMLKYSNSQGEYSSVSQQKFAAGYNKLENENTFPLMRSNTQPANIHSSNLHEFLHGNPHPVRSRSVLSDGSLSKELNFDLHNRAHEHFSKNSASPAFQNKQEQIYEYEEDMGRSSRDFDQFTRSASARLPQTGTHGDGRPSSQDGGERKREESMKRLLEWKQRMLQSPLNRKLNPDTSKRLYSKYNPYYGASENGYAAMRNYEIYPEAPRFRTAAPQYNSYSSDDEASGSISIGMRDTVTRSAPMKKVWTPSTRSSQSTSSAVVPKGYENIASHMPHQGYISHEPSQQDLSSDTSQSSNSYRATWQFDDRMNVSAGELLGRTHEELILLLIQLRRQSANTCNAVEACYNEIESIQSRLPQMDALKRLENLQKLEQIKQHLLELEKQYEKGKPLVNLVDNMVKLGSLYRFPKTQNSNTIVKNRIEFNQQMQERRLLAEERKDWNRLSPNHMLLQTKVQQLYQLDRLIQEESRTLHGLQQDKEEIEGALVGLRQRLIKGFKDPAEIEQARKQQIMLENELSRVHSMLAQNSRKLEETVAGNARLEQELLVLKQKLQITKQQRSSPQISNAGDSLPCVIGTSAMLESDLHRVQQKVGDLQRQRQELSMQVRQLTDRSSNLQQSRMSSTCLFDLSTTNKRKNTMVWRETDLDTMNTVDYGGSLDNLASSPIPLSPLYINTNLKQNQEMDILSHGLKSSDSASDDTLYNQIVLPQEKQEIKTVRIVKRESERRQRDREKTTTGKWDSVIEEDDAPHNSGTPFHPQNTKALDIMSSNISEFDKFSSGSLSRQSSSSNPSSIQQTCTLQTSLNDETSKLSPIFKSEAAKQIMNEMSTKDTPKQLNRRAIPKEKRRHYTAPHNNLIMKSLSQLPIADQDFDRLDVNIGRARDDLDMERALRQQIDAPDVVRSTLSNKELKYNESTIDNILGTPNKILIPERYVPEQLPQLSAEEQQHRLRKVESIKKMLSDTTIISGSTVNLSSEYIDSETPSSSSITSKNTSKMLEEKKQREHLLQLNQILAKQVMEMSKIVAGSNNVED